MPRREDERERPSSLRYCVFCRRYMSAGEWDTHPHNPDKGASRARARIRRVLIILDIVEAVVLALWLLGDAGPPS